MRAYRWHISRKVEEREAETEAEPTVDVTITAATDALPRTMVEEEPKAPRYLPPDEMMWWDTPEGSQLEGTTTEAALLQALTERNLLVEGLAPEVEDEERQIVEDMVLVQLVEDEERYGQLWEGLIGEQGLPDVTPLVEVEGAQWFDYTLPSRRMAKDLYRRVLGESEEMEEGPDAKQS
jgi:hypothetical protein